MSVRLERLIRIYNRLRRGPVTIEIISKWAKSARIKVSDRQLYRDLNSLQNLHVAEGENVIEFIDEKNRKTWKLEYDEEGEKISQYDINSFFLLKNFAPYTVVEHRKSSIEKFEKIIYRELSKSKLQQSVQATELYLHRTNYMENLYGEIEHKQIEEIIWALQNKRMIVIEDEQLNVANLHFPVSSFPLAMCPMELVFHSGRVHIAGLGKTNEQFLIFALDKSLKFSLTNISFDRKKLTKNYSEKFEKRFAISDPINDKVYNIKLEFTKGYGESFQTYYWHHSRKWKLLKNGNYILELRCSIGRELIGFIAAELDKMKVHSPKILKELMVKKFKLSALVNERDLKIDEKKANQEY